MTNGPGHDAATLPLASADSALAPAAGGASARATVAVAATFTADGLEPPLAFLLNVAGLPLDIAFAPYHQVFQELLTPQSLLARNGAGGVNVLLLRLEDFVRDAPDTAQALELLARTLGELTDAVPQFTRRTAAATAVIVFRPSPGVAEALRQPLADATSALVAALDGVAAGGGVIVSEQIDALCDAERTDPVADRLAHIPYTDDYLAALALVLTRRIHLLRVPAHKVLVLDCDNTIWRGVVGEDGVHGIGIDPEFLAVQRFAVEAQAKGTLVCLASKNAEADVLEVLDARTDMLLKAEHIVAHRINWEAKAGNLRALARELNLGLDAFVFVDDNPVECGQMQEVLPDVVTLQLPPLSQVGAFLAHLWVFDKVAVTQEDVRRTAMYRENAARDSLEASAGDIGEFLAALELVIDIAAPTDDEWPRVSQLTHRTNQFNFTTLRRSEAELRAMVAAGAVVQAVHVRDRFGDYGLVGVVVAERRAAELRVDTFLLSCRVLGRGVEHATVARLGALALGTVAGVTTPAAPLADVRLPYRRTPKNEPARAFADSVVPAWRQGEGDAFDYVVPAAVAAAVAHTAGADAPEVVEARRADAKKAGKPAAAAVGTGRSARYLRLASELTSGPAVVRALRAQTARLRDLDTVATPARTASERAILLLWEDLLGIHGLGIDDDFFALGGSSLQAARLFADLAHHRGVSLPLTTILQAPTVRLLAAQVDRGDVAAQGGLIPLQRGGPRKLFLVHDGDGETLLYRNIAHRAPADLSVYGIQPKRLKHVPLAHTRIEAMAAAYIDTLRAEQPHGPYLLGGMCAGGLIAYEMAVQLERAGERVDRVLLLDAATPQAERRTVSRLAARSSRLGDALAAARQGRHGVGAAIASAKVIAGKVRSVAAYETGKWLRGWSERARYALLERVVRGERSWPDSVPALDFRAIYHAAEARYVPPASPELSAVLLRARAGRDDDQGDVAYSSIYQDATLGWGAVVGQLDVIDVEGGHASMLQEPHAAALAEALRPHLQAPVAATASAHNGGLAAEAPTAATV